MLQVDVQGTDITEGGGKVARAVGQYCFRLMYRGQTLLKGGGEGG